MKTYVIVWRIKAIVWKIAWIRGKIKWTAGKTGWIVAKISATTVAVVIHLDRWVAPEAEVKGKACRTIHLALVVARGKGLA